MCPDRTFENLAEDAVTRELFSASKFPANREKYGEFLSYDPTLLG
jgi:hypothetical protein